MYRRQLSSESSCSSAIMGSVTLAMEAYLSTTTFAECLQKAYCAARGGGGSNDRNISAQVLRETCLEVHASLPSPLDEIPDPDAAFVEKAVATVLPDVSRSGVRDEEGTHSSLTHACAQTHTSCAIMTDSLWQLPTRSAREWENTIRADTHV